MASRSQDQDPWGELMGAAPTGSKVMFDGIDMFMSYGGKVVEVWHQSEESAAIMQPWVEPPARP